MDQEGEDRGGEENNKQPQPQPPQPHPPPPQPQQHQKCPRCDSLNTKFCYYNNYSLSQPRYFCKSCKRYWTQGGTMRNIPVGGSRKGKRGNRSSSSSSSSSSHKPYRSQQPQPSILPHEVVQNQQSNLTTLVGPSPSTVVPPTNSPYGGGYLSSLAAVHSLNPSSQSQALNQSLSFGFNASDSLGSEHHQHSQILPSRFYHMGKVGSNLYPASQQGLIPSSMGSSSAAASHLDHGASDASLWSTISTTSISGNSDQSNIRGGSSSLTPNLHWPHLPGYGDPPE